jgi:hypothetical protein
MSLSAFFFLAFGKAFLVNWITLNDNCSTFGMNGTSIVDLVHPLLFCFLFIHDAKFNLWDDNGE